MTIKPNFNARCSALGGYSACSMRAWLDHGLQTGKLPLADWGITPNSTRTSSPPADWGTCNHWYSQASMRCQFMPDNDWNNMVYTGWDDAAALAAKYSAERWALGSSLFKSQTEATTIMAQMAIDIQSHMPRDKDTNWMAEACFQINGLLNGHIDFLSEDWQDIVDLKTTSTKPTNGRPKPTHIWQLVGYALGVYHATGTLPRYGHILYAHSRGDWTFRANPVDFHSPMIQTMIKQLINRLTVYADWDLLSGMAYPSFGEACSDYCPYTRSCRDAAIPRGVAIRGKVQTPLTSSNPLN